MPMRPYFNLLYWQWAAGATLLIFMLIVSTQDIKRKRIANTLLLAMLCAGIFFNALSLPTAPERLAYQWAPLGAPLALLGVVVGLLLLIPLYLARGLGAGDVKLMGVLGSFFGPVEIINLTLVVLVAGGCFAAVRMVWIEKTRQALSNIAGLVGTLNCTAQQRFDPSVQSVERMPFAPAIAAGVLIYGGWRCTGGSAFIHF